MLSRVKIFNFRSLVQVEVPLKPLTVLIGKNDSGKSTFLQALMYLTHRIKFDPTDRTRYDLTREIYIEVQTPGDAEVSWGTVGKLGTVPGGANYLAVDAGELYQLPVRGAPMISDGYSDQSGAKPLGSDGEGISSLLDYLLRRDRRRFFSLVNSLKDHIPGLMEIEIATPNPATRQLDLVLENGFRIPAEEASAGVRLIIFFIALAFHPTPPKLILIEEPETGIHPRRLEDVVRLLRQITRGEHGAEPAQVILTTHSPYLLDYVNSEEDQVLVFKRNDDGSRTAEPVDTERLKDFLSEFMLGEVWYNQGEEGLVKPMIRIHFVGDGPRDAATIPELVGTIVGAEIQLAEHSVTNWFHLRDKGYEKKVLFALLRAQDLKASALVAVVDRDKAPKGERLEKLRKGREEHRNKFTPIPAALGEADPHGEAWLLDDEAAVRQALRLDPETRVRSVKEAQRPKEELESLIAVSKRRQEPSIDLLTDIARLVQPARCSHKSETGFDAFMKEVHAEIGALKSRAVENRDENWP